MPVFSGPALFLLGHCTFIGIHGSHWGLRLCRLLHGLLCFSFGELRRIGQAGLGGSGGRLLSCHRCSLVGHGARGDPSFTAALAVGSLPATWRVLLLPVLVLPAVTLVFVLADVSAVSEIGVREAELENVAPFSPREKADAFSPPQSNGPHIYSL